MSRWGWVVGVGLGNVGLQMIVIYSIMHSNIWNLCSGKQRLGILEKTHAQKRHLINIITAKSQLDTRQPHHCIQHRSFSPLSLTQKQTLIYNNQNLARKLILISKTQHSTKRELSVSRNLQAYSSVNRITKQREIQEENTKMFSRLITTPATLNREEWSKSSRDADRYKENLHRSRYPQPDYSVRATKMIKSSAKFKCLLTARKASTKRVKKNMPI